MPDNRRALHDSPEMQGAVTAGFGIDALRRDPSPFASRRERTGNWHVDAYPVLSCAHSSLTPDAGKPLAVAPHYCVHHPFIDMHDYLFTAYLLIVLPAYSLWASFRRKPAASSEGSLRDYWRQARLPLGLLIVLCVVSLLSDHSPREIGLDLPLSQPGRWGLLFAAVLLACLRLIEMYFERRTSPEDRLKHQAILDSLPFAMPSTRLETLVYVLCMSIATAAWEILYRGYLLLILTPLMGLPMAVILAAVSYGVAHGYTNPRQLLGSIIAAFAFTTAYAFTGSLWWLIVLHAAAPLTMVSAVRRMQAASGVDPVVRE
jgi:membrane protease YdiL (CAAX protease family)